MSDENVEQSGSSATKTTMLIMGAVLILPFVPLFLAVIERLITGTNVVENLCRAIGIHDELDALYNAIGRLFR